MGVISDGVSVGYFGVSDGGVSGSGSGSSGGGDVSDSQ